MTYFYTILLILLGAQSAHEYVFADLEHGVVAWPVALLSDDRAVFDRPGGLSVAAEKPRPDAEAPARSGVDVFDQRLEHFAPRHLLPFLVTPLALLAFVLFVHRYHGENPWLRCWFSPRLVIRRAGEDRSRGVLVLLTMLLGISYALDNLLFSLGEIHYPASWIWAAILLLAPLGGAFQVCFWGWSLSVSGRWLQGKGRAFSLRRVVAWSAVPALAGIPIYLLLFFIMGTDLFMADALLVEEDMRVLSFALGSILSLLVLVAWRAVLHVAMLAEVQGFGLLRSIVTIGLACILLVACVLLLVLLVAIPLGILSNFSGSSGGKEVIAGQYAHGADWWSTGPAALVPYLGGKVPAAGQ